MQYTGRVADSFYSLQNYSWPQGGFLRMPDRVAPATRRLQYGRFVCHCQSVADGICVIRRPIGRLTMKESYRWSYRSGTAYEFARSQAQSVNGSWRPFRTKVTRWSAQSRSSRRHAAMGATHS